MDDDVETLLDGIHCGAGEFAEAIPMRVDWVLEVAIHWSSADLF